MRLVQQQYSFCPFVLNHNIQTCKDFFKYYKANSNPHIAPHLVYIKLCKKIRAPRRKLQSNIDKKVTFLVKDNSSV